MEKYKIGDKVTITSMERNYSRYSIGESFIVGYVRDDKNGFVCETCKDEGNGVFFPSIKLAEAVINNYQIY